MSKIIDNEGNEHEKYQSSLTVTEEDEALANALRIPELENMLLDTVNTMSYSTASVLYEFNGTALTKEDGTRYLRNKALHVDGIDGKLYSGNPLDFQGSQVINCGDFALSGQKATYLLKVNMHDITLKQYLMHMDLVPIIWVHGGYLKVSINATGLNILALEKNKDYVIAVAIDNNIIKVFVNDNLQYQGACNNIATNGTLYLAGGIDGNYADCSFDYALLIDDAITIDEIKRFRYEPERAIIDYGTNRDLKGVFVTDFSGDDNYITNICNPIIYKKLDVSNILTNSKSNIDNTATLIADNYIHYKHDNTKDQNSFATFTLADMKIPPFSIVIADIDIQQDSVGSVKVDLGSSSQSLKKGINILFYDKPTESLFVAYRSSVPTNLKIKIKSSNIINGSILKIKGYNDTLRINYKREARGFQGALVKKDELGFTQGLSNSLPSGRDIFKSNIKLLARENYTFEILISGFKVNTYVGASKTSVNRILLGNSSSQGYLLWLGGTSIVLESKKILHVFIVKDENNYVCYQGENEVGRIPTTNINLDIDFSCTDVNGRPDLNIPETKTYVLNKYPKIFSTSEIKLYSDLRLKQYPNIGESDE